MRVAMDCHGLTHPGHVRETNEDQFLVADLTKAMLVRQTSLAADDHTRLFGALPGHLLAVADGLGGQPGGRLASGLAVRTLVRYVLDTLPWFLRAGMRRATWPTTCGPPWRSASGWWRGPPGPTRSTGGWGPP